MRALQPHKDQTSSAKRSRLDNVHPCVSRLGGARRLLPDRRRTVGDGNTTRQPDWIAITQSHGANSRELQGRAAPPALYHDAREAPIGRAPGFGISG